MGRWVKVSLFLLSVFLVVGLIYREDIGLYIKDMEEQSKQRKYERYMATEYFWQAGVSGTVGYPIYVSTGGFSNKPMSSTFGGKIWGSPSFAWAAGKDPLPTRLSCEWVSFIESEEKGKVYRISTDIDYDKIRALFDQGFDLVGESGKVDHKTFWVIIAGFAPGGTVIVWVDGAGRREEIGRYQGYEVSKEAPDFHRETLEKLEPYWQNVYLNNGAVVKANVRARTKNKPVPYGLWDSLRQRFNYRIVFEYPDQAKPINFINFSGNGELKYNYPNKNNEFDIQNEAVPREISYVWRTEEGVKLATSVYFEESYLLDMFKRMNRHNPDAPLDLIIRFNELYDYYTVRIRNSEGKEEFVKLNPYEKVKIFETRRKD